MTRLKGIKPDRKSNPHGIVGGFVGQAGRDRRIEKNALTQNQRSASVQNRRSLVRACNFSVIDFGLAAETLDQGEPE